MQKNDELIGKVISYGYNGEGIIKEEQITVFVPFCIVGEIIKYKVLKVQKNIAYGKIIEIIQSSPDRILPKCQIFTKCGGCQLQHLKYSEQLKLKEQLVADCFKKIAGLDVKIKPTIASDKIFGYRNKLQLPIRRENGENQIGFYAPNSHRIIQTSECVLHEDWAQKIISSIKYYIEKANIVCYNEIDKKGSLRHLVVRKVKNSFIIVLVTATNLKNCEIFIDKVKEELGDVSVYINYNKNNNNVILGDKFSLIYGKGFITDNSLGIEYDVGPESFVQINEDIKNKLYLDIKNFIGDDEQTTVIDAYSGVGLLTAIMAKGAKRAYGVEIIAEAVQSANNLAKRNGLEGKMSSICASCEDVLPDLIKNTKGNVKIVVDPPRKGVDINSLKAMRESTASQIIYCSCSPQSLARDIGILLGTVDEQGRITKNATPKYEIASVQPYDMFPNTKHVESVVCLTRR